jgi:hypothetical protein
MSCRTGPLRVGRAFARLFNLSSQDRLRGPPVGRKMMIPTNGRTYADDPCKTGIHATKWPRHAQWARPQDMLLKIAAQFLLTFDSFEESLEVSFAKAAAALALDDLVEDGRAIFDRLGEDLQHVAFVVAVDEDA